MRLRVLRPHGMASQLFRLELFVIHLKRVMVEQDDRLLLWCGSKSIIGEATHDELLVVKGDDLVTVGWIGF